jgi:hypothetical protein
MSVTAETVAAIQRGNVEPSGDETYEDRLARLGIDEFTNRVWCLIYSMRERGVTGDDPWWGQDFLRVQELLEAKGLNCDPEKTPTS